MIVVILLVLFVVFVFGAGDALCSLLKLSCSLLKLGWVIAEFVFKCVCSIIEFAWALFDGGGNASCPTTPRPASNPVVSNTGSLSRKPDVEAVAKGSLIVIDGSNVIGACEKLGALGLEAVERGLVEAGYSCKVFVDKSIFGWLNRLRDEDGIRYIRRGERHRTIFVAPNKAEADGQILQLAKYEYSTRIITNDRYRDYYKLHPWLNESKKLHGINVIPMDDGRYRILIEGFNLDIVVKARSNCS